MNHSLSLEALAASQLMAALREQGEDDDETLTTAVEGETGLLEAVDAALAELREVEIQRAGIRQIAETLELRESRLGDKAQRIKQHLLAAIECAGVPTPLRRPTCTIGVSRGRAKAVITDEGALPDEYRRTKLTTSPDVALITQALIRGEQVPGACLSNACPSLTLRVR